MNSKKHIAELHAEINQWKNQIAFVQDELKMFQQQLAAASISHKEQAVKMQVGHFESVFIRQDEVNDELLHEIKLADASLAKEVEGNPAADRVLFEDHTDLRDKMDVFGTIWQDNKQAFRSFVTEALQ